MTERARPGWYGKARRAIPPWIGREAHRDRSIPEQPTDYPPVGSKLTEDELIRAKRGSAPEPAERPETAAIDENGFLHGEPLSEGRTARPEGDTE